MNALKATLALASAAVGLAVAASPAAAQRGVGAPIGVAQAAVKPETATLAGTLTAVNVGPCEHTTGRGRVGVHFILQPAPMAAEAEGSQAAEAKPLNIHVGPAAVVGDLLAKFAVGDQLTVSAFRTEAMPAGHFVAERIASDTQTVTLRDETLRPTWAGGGGGRGPNAGAWGGHGYRHGDGYGRGYRRGGNAPGPGPRQANCPWRQ